MIDQNSYIDDLKGVQISLEIRKDKHVQFLSKCCISNCMEINQDRMCCQKYPCSKNDGFKTSTRGILFNEALSLRNPRQKISSEILLIKCTIENKSLAALFNGQKLSPKTLKINICVIRETNSKNKVYSIKWCKSELQLVACLTKGTVKSRKLLTVLKNGSGLLQWLVIECLRYQNKRVYRITYWNSLLELFAMKKWKNEIKLLESKQNLKLIYDEKIEKTKQHKTEKKVKRKKNSDC